VLLGSKNLANVCTDILKNKAKTMQAESIWRFDYLDSITNKNAVIPRLSILPQTFMAPEWGPDTNNWTNRHLATLFNKQSISVNHSINVEQFKTKEQALYGINKFGGFEFFVDKAKKSLIVNNISGDEEMSFFLHFTPLNGEVLAEYKSSNDFVNADFRWQAGEKQHIIPLPEYKLHLLHIGQYSGDERPWSQVIYFEGFYE